MKKFFVLMLAMLWMSVAAFAQADIAEERRYSDCRNQQTA